MSRLIAVLLALLVLPALIGMAAEEPPAEEKKAPVEEETEKETGKETGPADEEKAPAGEKETPPEAPKAPAEEEAPLPKSDPAAIELFDKAIAHQAPKEFTGADSIADLFVRIQAEVWDYRGKDPKKQSVNVSRFLTRSPRRFRSEWRTTAGLLVNGYDGRRFWFADYDAANTKKQAILLTGGRYKDDRQRIEDERAETEYLIRFFFLGNLKGGKAVFTMKPEETIDAYGKKECFVLHRVNHDPKSTDPALTLWFEKETHELVRAVAHARSKGDRTLRFTFRNDADVQPRVKGVLFPFKMEMHEKSDQIGKYRLLSRATLEEKGIDFNSNLDEKLFFAPIGDNDGKKDGDGKVDAEK